MQLTSTTHIHIQKPTHPHSSTHTQPTNLVPPVTTLRHTPKDNSKHLSSTIFSSPSLSLTRSTHTENRTHMHAFLSRPPLPPLSCMVRPDVQVDIALKAFDLIKKAAGLWVKGD